MVWCISDSYSRHSWFFTIKCSTISVYFSSRCMICNSAFFTHVLVLNHDMYGFGWTVRVRWMFPMILGDVVMISVTISHISGFFIRRHNVAICCILVFTNVWVTYCVIMLNVRPSACPFLCHTYIIMFLFSYHHEIYHWHYRWQKWCPCKRSRSSVKFRDHGSRIEFCINYGIS